MSENNSRLVYSNDPNRQPPSASQGAPGSGKAVVRLERKGRAGKTVTLAERLAVSDDELRRLLKELQSVCGTGGTVKDHCLELQGDHQARVRDFLRQRGYRVGG